MTITDLEVIDVFYEDSDDPEAENGLAIIVRVDGGYIDPKQLMGQRITITTEDLQ
jgi:hypothetical protein